jgi:hypothetical protein
LLLEQMQISTASKINLPVLNKKRADAIASALFLLLNLHNDW